jgi:hypothetical protein
VSWLPLRTPWPRHPLSLPQAPDLPASSSPPWHLPHGAPLDSPSHSELAGDAPAPARRPTIPAPTVPRFPARCPLLSAHHSHGRRVPSRPGLCSNFSSAELLMASVLPPCSIPHAPGARAPPSMASRRRSRLSPFTPRLDIQARHGALARAVASPAFPSRGVSPLRTPDPKPRAPSRRRPYSIFPF